MTDALTTLGDPWNIDNVIEGDRAQKHSFNESLSVESLKPRHNTQCLCKYVYHTVYLVIFLKHSAPNQQHTTE